VNKLRIDTSVLRLVRAVLLIRVFSRAKHFHAREKAETLGEFPATSTGSMTQHSHTFRAGQAAECLFVQKRLVGRGFFGLVLKAPSFDVFHVKDFRVANDLGACTKVQHLGRWLRRSQRRCEQTFLDDIIGKTVASTSGAAPTVLAECLSLRSARDISGSHGNIGVGWC